MHEGLHNTFVASLAAACSRGLTALSSDPSGTRPLASSPPETADLAKTAAIVTISHGTYDSAQRYLRLSGRPRPRPWRWPRSGPRSQGGPASAAAGRWDFISVFVRAQTKFEPLVSPMRRQRALQSARV